MGDEYNALLVMLSVHTVGRKPAVSEAVPAGIVKVVIGFEPLEYVPVQPLKTYPPLAVSVSVGVAPAAK
jgi:hypothetical protein